jgi:predicted small secreted protein
MKKVIGLILAVLLVFGVLITAGCSQRLTP